jgi:hypothetical protein
MRRSQAGDLRKDRQSRCSEMMEPCEFGIVGPISSRQQMGEIGPRCEGVCASGGRIDRFST